MTEISLHDASQGIPFLTLLPSAFFPIVIIVFLALVGIILWYIWTRPLPFAREPVTPEDIVEGQTVMPRAFLTQAEATLLNLIRLAVQDHYLVFAKVPASTLVKIVESEPRFRAILQKALSLVRLDVVLVHPGTLYPIKAMQFISEGDDDRRPNGRDRWVDAVLHHAGIEVIRLESHTTYTVAKLVNLLGLGEDEESP